MSSEVIYKQTNGRRRKYFKKVCPGCEEEFETRSDNDAEYCSRSCKMKNDNPMKDPDVAQKVNGSRDHSGENNPAYNSTEIECEWCEEVLEVPKSEAPRRKYCSKQCFYSAVREEDWDGPLEYTKRYGGLWNDIREKVLERDDHECQECGSEDVRLEVHHIKPIREFEDPQNAHYMENLITLCVKHHRRADAGALEVKA